MYYCLQIFGTPRKYFKALNIDIIKELFCRLNISHKMLLVSTTATNEATQERTNLKNSEDSNFFLPFILSQKRMYTQLRRLLFAPLYASFKNQTSMYADETSSISITQLSLDKKCMYAQITTTMVLLKTDSIIQV